MKLLLNHQVLCILWDSNKNPLVIVHQAKNCVHSGTITSFSWSVRQNREGRIWMVTVSTNRFLFLTASVPELSNCYLNKYSPWLKSPVRHVFCQPTYTPSSWLKVLLMPLRYFIYCNHLLCFQKLILFYSVGISVFIINNRRSFSFSIFVHGFKWNRRSRTEKEHVFCV